MPYFLVPRFCVAYTSLVMYARSSCRLRHRRCRRRSDSGGCGGWGFCARQSFVYARDLIAMSCPVPHGAGAGAGGAHVKQSSVTPPRRFNILNAESLSSFYRTNALWETLTWDAAAPMSSSRVGSDLRLCSTSKLQVPTCPRQMGTFLDSAPGKAPYY